MSPSSDVISPASPPTDTVTGSGYHSGEDESDLQPGYQYSSQDSLPDSPYSSQSLDSQSQNQSEYLFLLLDGVSIVLFFGWDES